MNPSLIRRLIGAGVLVALAFIVSLLLPDPARRPELEEGLKAVEIGVDESRPLTAGDIQQSGADASSDERDRGRRQESRPALSESASADTRSDDTGDKAAEAGLGKSVEIAASREPDESQPEPELEASAPDFEAPAESDPEPDLAPEPAPPSVSKPTPPAKEAKKPVAAVPKAAEAKPAPAKPVEPKPTTPRPAEAKPVQPATTAAKPGADTRRWAVQAGSYADIGNARQIQAQLKSLGYASNIMVVDTPAGARYRVRSGPFPNREAADAAAKRIAAAKLPAQPVPDGT